ncbi:helix-turn-helix domain-containing protein [Hwanghaeella grinnelliae]|uniref:Helix-turn-helix domain-containing protein n=2 Tax=Hwanghaeella grinnelliae TaxID=2500179 RepID=A0A3S2WPV4_9PROT|nr:helix-turn-helix domain-containing protein [Hwanghaeella grinnelliae]
MTTAEVAALLRVKERKIYELVSENQIPHTKVTGKLLFPKALVRDWIKSGTSTAGARSHVDRPLVAAGSHDPLLDWALAESGCGIGPMFDGSLDGFARFRRGEALFAGIHVPDPTGTTHNFHLLDKAREEDLSLVLVTWAVRRQGLMFRPREGLPPGGGDPLSGLAGSGLRVQRRQDTAGSRVLLEGLLERHAAAQGGIDAVNWSETAARTETEAALAVLEGAADATFGIETVAKRFKLTFVPVATERYDILIAQNDFFASAFQKLLVFARCAAFAEKAAALGGYDIALLGTTPDRTASFS